MRKILLINFLLIVSLFSTHGMEDIAKHIQGASPTSIIKRSQFFKAHGDDEKSIFKEMSKWHEEDYAALLQTVKLPANYEKLKLVHDTLNKTFENETVTHSKIAAVYKTYSAIISSKSEMANAEDAEDEASVDDTIQEVIDYCVHDKIRQQMQHSISNIYQMTTAERYNVRWLPYVSRKGISPFRVLNSQFGMKAPLGGLPLERSTYDGNLNETPFSFFRHEANHGGFFDANNGAREVIDFIYDCYREADAIVSQLTDIKVQALCDFFLFEVGHESFFDIKTVWGNDEIDDEGHYKRPFTLQLPKDLNEVCDNILKYFEEDILKLSRPSPLYSQKEIMNMQLIEEWKDKEEMKDLVESLRKSIKDRESILSPFINLNREGQYLFTLTELINKFQLNKSKPLSKKEITEPIQSGFLNTLPLLPMNPFDHWCLLDLKLQFYNQLLGYKHFFNKNGIDFNLWKDDVFQTDAIIAVFKEACDTFKREVGTQFKGYDDYVARLDKAEKSTKIQVQYTT